MPCTSDVGSWTVRSGVSRCRRGDLLLLTTQRSAVLSAGQSSTEAIQKVKLRFQICTPQSYRMENVAVSHGRSSSSSNGEDGGEAA